MRLDAHFDAGLAVALGQPDVAEDKTRKALNQVQDGLNLELDGWFPWFDLSNRLDTQSADRKPAIFCFGLQRSASVSGMNQAIRAVHSGGRASGGDGLSSQSSRPRRPPLRSELAPPVRIGAPSVFSSFSLPSRGSGSPVLTHKFC